MASRWRALVMVYGVLNAIAYSVLLPLWEGFDESYHYGYVQFLSTQLRFPVLGQASLSREVWDSLQLAPVSHYLQPFTRAPVNFRDYFALSQAERARRRRELESLPANEKYEPQPGKLNYEVNQSPLPYVGMAVLDRMLSGYPLTTRVLWLRLICSVSAALLLAHASLLLSRLLSLPDAYITALLFCVFSSQMLYATICHVCNDWLAAPILGYLIWAMVRAHQSGSRGDYLTLGLILAAALLTKAYFLVFLPLVFALAAWDLRRRRASMAGAALFLASVALLAGPWLIRNVLLYRNLSATVESTSGVGRRQLFEAALALPWRRSIVYMAHASLWTGNNSFTTFSSTTLDLVLLALAVGLVQYFLHWPQRAPDRIVTAAIALFCGGLAFISATFYAASNGAAWAAVPWYMQGLLAPVLLLAFLGMSRAHRWGSATTRLTVVLWGYVLAATYLAKLIPMYGGFPQSQTHIPALWGWYLHGGEQRDAILKTLCLASPGLLWGLTIAVIALDVVFCCRLARHPEMKNAIIAPPKRQPTGRRIETCGSS